MSEESEVKIEIVDKLGVLLEIEKKIKIIVGGRASTKSTFKADNVLARVSNGERWCCAREVQDSIEDSVHAMLIDEIERCRFEGFIVQKNAIYHESGGQIFYKGLSRNISSLKGLNADGLWIEEGEGLSAQTIKVLTASLRVSALDAQIAKETGEKAKVPEIWITMNRGASKDPVSQKFLKRAEKDLARCGYYEDDYLMVVEINYDEIPEEWFIGSGLEEERLDDLKNMTQAEYDHKWKGKYSDSVKGAIIKPAWFDACVDAHKLKHLKERFKPLGVRVAAHDPFDDGGDAGGYSARHGSIITHVAMLNEGEIDKVCDWATGLAHEDRVDWFVWDGDGMGTGLKRQVSLAFNGTAIKYHMYRGSLSGSGQDHANEIYMPEESDDSRKKFTYAQTFKNNRSQYYAELARRCYNTYKCVEHGEFIDPDDMISFDSDGIEEIDLLRSEICRIPKKKNASGLYQIMSKDEMKKLGIESPNLSDSVMMCLFIPPMDDDEWEEPETVDIGSRWKR